MRTISVLMVLVAASMSRADLFDDISNKDITRYMSTDVAQPLQEVTANHLSLANNFIPQSNASIVLVRTKDGRNTKLLVQTGLQKVNGIKQPVLFIEKYATYVAGEDQAVVVNGGPIHLFPGLHFNCDVGQVVTPLIGGDIEMLPAEVLSKLTIKPMAGAKLYLVRKKPVVEASRPASVQFAEPFEAKYFNGAYKLYDDGRRSGTLTLKVDEKSGEVTGSFYTDKDGQKYDVTGKVGTVRHQITFTIKYPQSAGEYSGFMFTGDGKAIAGTSRLRDRDTSFYAVRSEAGS